jgi:primosomal protein N' (replication factor Y)
MEIAKVEPMTTTRALRGPFDYRLPEPMVAAGVGVGSLLTIPFGGRRMLGVVVDVAAESDLPPERLAEPIEAIEAGATPDLVRLGLWVAERYCSTPSRGLALILPPGAGTGRRPRPAKPRTERIATITADGVAALRDGQGPRLGSRQRAALAALDGAGAVAAGELRERTGADSVVLRRLAERGLIERDTREVRRVPRIETVGAGATAPRLSRRRSPRSSWPRSTATVPASGSFTV